MTWRFFIACRMISENDSVKLIFGLKLRSLRQQKGLSYQQLSEATKLAISYLHDIENGRKYPKADKIMALTKALGVEYDYLVSLNGGKKLQPIIDLISSEFINVIPWEHFGLSPASLLELFSNTPDKVTAFISTLIKISRAYQMSTESFYTTALRSYQDLHDNYFEDLEATALRFRQEHNLEDHIPLQPDTLITILQKQYDIQIDRKKMGTVTALNSLRSYFAAEKKVLYINKQLSPAQEAFLLSRELAFQYLQITERSYETIIQHPGSFDVLLHNFRASYFAAALLIPEDNIAADLRTLMRLDKWDGNAWLQLLDKYSVTPEMLMQRLTNILPHHFGIDQLFFLRMTGNIARSHYDITKELHLSQLHNPHANAISEHYCRRWLAIDMMQQTAVQVAKKKYKQPAVGIQVSHYHQTHNRYLAITFAKPRQKSSEEMISVTLGLMMDKQLLQSMRFVHDPSLPEKIVNTACERCSIMDCQERGAPPTVILEKEKQIEINTALQSLEK